MQAQYDGKPTEDEWKVVEKEGSQAICVSGEVYCNFIWKHRKQGAESIMFRLTLSNACIPEKLIVYSGKETAGVRRQAAVWYSIMTYVLRCK